MSYLTRSPVQAVVSQQKRPALWQSIAPYPVIEDAIGTVEAGLGDMRLRVLNRRVTQDLSYGVLQDLASMRLRTVRMRFSHEDDLGGVSADVGDMRLRSVYIRAIHEDGMAGVSQEIGAQALRVHKLTAATATDANYEVAMVIGDNTLREV